MGRRERIVLLAAGVVVAGVMAVPGGIAGAATAPSTVAVGAAGGAGAPGSITGGGHAYRHGAVPNLHFYLTHKSQFTAATSTNDLNFGGGISGVGVTTGPEQVYLVFWGSQWGTESVNGSGYATFSGDPQGMAPDLQAFFEGLGTGGETWSGVMTQYCQGVATGSQSCPSSNTYHVGYPTGGALAGVWEDTSSASPAASTAHQLAQEAENAATHFGNTTTASNRNAQYVIVSPTGTNPDNYQTGGFCAWHDYSGDSSMDGGGAVSGPVLAFTNLPYIPDAGAGCGQNFVNSGSAGTLDGVTIVEGHEYAETVTDQFPAGGWTDSSGAETGDKCAWISSGQGASQNITLTTGTFAVQSTWANDFNGGSGGCEVSHPIVTNPGGGNTVTVTNPGNQTGTAGRAASLQIHATDSGGATLSYSATGLPAGLSINSSSGLISGTPTTAGTSSVTVTATDTTGSGNSASFSWTVDATVPGAPAQLSPTGTTADSVTLEWRPPSSAGGTFISGYDVFMGTSPGGEDYSAPVNGAPLSSLAGSYTVTGLTTLTTYYFTVEALDQVGRSAHSNEESATTKVAEGYWLATASGHVYGAGAASSLGGLTTTSANPVVGIAGSPDGKGYVVVTRDGTVGAFGDARFAGDLPRLGVHVSDIVAIAPTTDGRGYWLVGADGGEFAFGDAKYHGSLPGLGLHVSDIVGMVASPNGAGYLLVGADGGVFAFGAAGFYGSLPKLKVHVDDIRAILPSSTGKGYVLVGADGGAFVFGTGVRYYGSLPSRKITVSDIVGIALTPGDGGYFMAGADGTVYAFGDAAVQASPSGLSSELPVVAIAGV